MTSTCAKPTGAFSRQCNPQVPLAHGLLKDGVACRLTQNRFRRVATQKPRGGQLDFRDLTDILWPRPNDRVVADARRLTRETPQSGLHQHRQLRIRCDTLCIQSRSIQSHGDGRLADHTRRHDRERLDQRSPGAGRSARGVQESDRLVNEFSAADHPVERVLQDAGNAMRVFRAGEQDGIRRFEGGSECRNRHRRCVGIQIGVERRQLVQPLVNRDLDPGRCELRSRLDQRTV